MARFIINGGTRLQGSFTPGGNKNAALPMLAACLLTDEAVTLSRLPLIEDVQVMLRLLESLGVTVSLRGHTVTLCAKGLRDGRPDPGLCRRVRGSILLVGPLLTQFRKVVLSPPGGDVIGRRRLDPHFFGFQQLGARVQHRDGLQLERKHLRGADILLDEASVTATENLVMAATRAEGVTTLYNAACEPHVQDLCLLLVKMGASIDGIGTNLIRIRGKKRLGGARHRIGPDYIEAGSFMAAAAATGGSLTVNSAGLQPVYPVMRRGFERIGVHWKVDGRRWQLPRTGKLTLRPDLGPAIPKLEDGPWPSFPSDLMSVSIVLATQASGSILFFEKMFESRMYFVDRLIEMGAHIVQCDPHRVMVVGPARLQGSLMSSPDIRAGMALIIAALCAEGESVIDNAQMIDRGYEQIDVRLRALGAQIERVE